MRGRRDLAFVLASFGHDARIARTAQELSSTLSRCVIDLVAAEHVTLLLRDGPESYRGVERGLRPLPPLPPSRNSLALQQRQLRSMKRALTRFSHG